MKLIESAEFGKVDWFDIDTVDAAASEIREASSRFNQRKLLVVNQVVCPKCLMGNLSAKGECNFCSRPQVAPAQKAKPSSQMFAHFCICMTVFALILVILGFLS